MRSIAKSWLSAVLIALCVGAYVYAQGLDRLMRVGGDILSIDRTIGTITLETSSGPRMNVLLLPGARSQGEFRAGDAVVVQFRQSAAQGVVNAARGAVDGRRPGTVDAISIVPAPLGFCSCSAPSDKGCSGMCVGSERGGSCRILEGIIYPKVCGVQ